MLQDLFCVALAVTIFFGLIVGTLLTMFVVPVLYTLFYGIRAPMIRVQRMLIFAK